MTPRQLEILQHTLGVDEYGRTPKGSTPYTRNHFCAGGADEPDCRALVALGFMAEHKRTEMYPYFNCSVTEAGKKAMHAGSPKGVEDGMGDTQIIISMEHYRELLTAAVPVEERTAEMEQLMGAVETMISWCPRGWSLELDQAMTATRKALAHIEGKAK